MKNNKGFSLVELIVVIAIMAILAAVAIPTFATFINKANVASDVSFLNDAEYAAQLAAASDASKVTKVTVEVDEKKAVKINITLEGNATPIEVVEANATATTGVTSLQKEVAAMIDWDYTFKKYTADGTYQIKESDSNTKELETVGSGN